jgi:hypothetical protein
VAYLLKSRNVEPEKQPSLANGSETTLVSRQWLGKHVPAATDMHATIEVLLETVFSTRPVQRGYKEDNLSGWKGAAVQREFEPGSRGIPIVEAVTRRRLITD